MYLFDKIGIHDITGWGSVLAWKSIPTERCQVAPNDQDYCTTSGCHNSKTNNNIKWLKRHNLCEAGVVHSSISQIIVLNGKNRNW